MSCERMREQIPECLAGRLDDAARERFIAHLDTCSACRAEVAQLGVVWRGMESVALPEPDAAMRSRFLEVLEAYQAGMQQAQERAIVSANRGGRIFAWWPTRTAWQAALAAALVIVGGLAGRYVAAPPAASPAANTEVAQLKGQVENLRQLVALSLLQEQSPSSRIQGASYSYKMNQPDRQVEQALLHAMNHDSNVNVRLSAVDALEKYAANPEIRRALVDAVPVQDSPLVEIALIDLLVQIDDRDALPAFRKLAREPQVDADVRQRATWAIGKLEVPK